MSSQQPETLITTDTVILTGPNDWDQWIRVIKCKANDEHVWEYIDPNVRKQDLPRHRAPLEPSPSVVNPQKTVFSTLDDDEKEELRALRKHYDRVYKQYEKEEAALRSLRTYIISTISRHYIDYTFEGNTVHDVLVSLKQRVAPSDEAREIQLATQYAKLKKAPRNQNFEVWLLEWEKVYTECKELGLPEVHGDRSVIDFAYAVESITPSWSGYWKNKFQMLEWKRKTLPSFFELVEIYRNYRRTELAREGKIPQGSSAVTFEEESTESSNSKPESSADEKKGGRPAPRCLCGKRHYYNQCWYIAESTCPSGWKPNDKIQKKVDDKIANATPEKKARIEQIKKDDQANKKPKDGNKQSSQEPHGVFSVYQAGAYNTASNYELRDSVLLASGTTVHIFNDRARFVSDIEPTSDRIYVGSHMEEIAGFGTAAVTIDDPKGKKQILLTGAAYMPGFDTNLVCIQKLNDKGVYWNNEENTLYYGDNETYAHCGYHYGRTTLEYNEPKRDSREASFATQSLKQSSKPLLN